MNKRKHAITLAKAVRRKPYPKRTPRRKTRGAALTNADRQVIADANNPDAWEPPIGGVLPAAHWRTDRLAKNLRASAALATDLDVTAMLSAVADRLDALLQIAALGVGRLSLDSIEKLAIRWLEVKPGIRLIAEVLQAHDFDAETELGDLVDQVHLDVHPYYTPTASAHRARAKHGRAERISGQDVAKALGAEYVGTAPKRAAAHMPHVTSRMRPADTKTAVDAAKRRKTRR